MTVRSSIASAAGLMALLALAVSAAAAPPSGSSRCRVALDFKIDGRTISSPTAVVEYEKNVDLTMRDQDDAAHGWRFELVVHGPAQRKHGPVIPADIRILELDGDRATLRAAPSVGASPGSVADLAMKLDGDDRKAELSVSLEPEA